MPAHNNQHNVLDLRRPTTPPPPPRRGWSRRGRHEELHQPPAVPRDWRGLGRETLKFVIGLAVVASTLALGKGLWHVGSQLHQIEALAEAAVGNIKQASHDLSQKDPGTAEQHFATARNQAEQATAELHQLDGVNGTLIAHVPYIQSRYRTAEHLISAVEHLAKAGALASSHLTADDLQQPAVTIDTKGFVSGSIAYIPTLIQHYDDWQNIVQNVVAAVHDVGQVSTKSLPASVKPFGAVLDGFRPLISGSPSRFDNLTTLLTTLVATPDPKDIIVIFQNNDELRATGGFAGTYVLVEFNKGTFKILDAPGNGPFALSEQIPHTSLPPQPLLAINPYWAFQDTNWFLDVPTSASFALDSYEQARGFRPDGVMYVSPQILESLLKITGPIRPDNYTVDITTDNFVRATEQQVQFGYDKALNNPKQFVIDLIPALFKKMSGLPAQDGLRAVLTFLSQAEQKNFLMYGSSKDLSTVIANLGWDGKILSGQGSDTVAVVDENLSGGKTDRLIDERVHVAVEDTDTAAKYTVTIQRSHGGKVGDPLTGDTNRDFIRVYAPSTAVPGTVTGATVPLATSFFPPANGAVASDKLLSAEGQVLVDPNAGTRITHESGHVVMGAWSVIAPGQGQTVTFTFSVPHDQPKQWSLIWQKQPGTTQRAWTVTYEAPKGKHVHAATGAKVTNGHRTATWSTNSDNDRLFSVSL